MSAAQEAMVPLAASARQRVGRRSGSVKLAVGLGIVVLLGIAAFAVPQLTGQDPNAQVLSERLLAPSVAHPFGTDALGRDVLTRTVVAVRIDIPIAVLGALIPAVIGSLLGLLAGYAGRWADVAIMRIADLLQSFPSYIFLILVAFVVGPGIPAFLVAAAFISWVNYARLVRSQVLLLRELDFVNAARLSGIGAGRVMLRHVLPNAIPQVVVYLASDAVLSLTFLAGLSFLGLGVQEPTAEWGLMISSGKLYLGTAWWLTAFPGLFIVLVGAAFSLISDALDEKARP